VAEALGGKIGRRGGGSSGGGGSRSFTGNPFSKRGVARLLGSGLAVYGLSEAANIASGFLNAADTANHPGRILHGYQDQNIAASAMNDPYLQGKAQQSATSRQASNSLAPSHPSPSRAGSFSYTTRRWDCRPRWKRKRWRSGRVLMRTKRPTAYLEGNAMRGAALTGRSRADGPNEWATRSGCSPPATETLHKDDPAYEEDAYQSDEVRGADGR